MGITINLTLLIQMVHFFCAYLIITRLFLKPGYLAVTADNQRVSHIRSRVVAHQELIAHKQAHKQTRWRLFQDYFYKQKPSIEEPLKSISLKKPFTYRSLTEEELNSLAREVTAQIEKKVIS